MTSIVVCGYPRSGSTMFYNMLRATVCGYTFHDREVPALQAAKTAGPQITKDPKDCFYADDILSTLGDVNFIVTIRDPRSVLCSKHVNTGGRYKVHADFTWKRAPRKKPRKLARHNIDSDKHHGLIAWDNALSKVPATAVVRYEDIVIDPDGVQEHLVDLFGFDCTGRFGDFHTADIPPKLAHQMNGVRPVGMERLESWRDHPERIRDQFSRFPELFDILEDKGYEKDRSWFDAI